MSRKCPACGEPVPSNSLTCPRCYRPIPREEKEPEGKPVSESNGGCCLIALLLATFPAVFGVLGLGLIYQDYRKQKGWMYLIFGLIVYAMIIVFVKWWIAGALLAKVLSTIMLVILALVYVSAFLAQLAETKFGSVMKIFRF